MFQKKFKVKRVAFAVFASLCISASASATNGYFSHGYGTQSKAMAGVGVALSLDSLTPATNPAGLLNVGDRRDIGLSYFSPDRGYDITGGPTGACMNAQQCTFAVGPESLRSDKEFFLIPHFGISRRLSENSVFGVAVYGNGGMNTRYVGGSATVGVPMGTVPPGISMTLPGTFGAGTAGVDLMQLFVTPTYAFGFGDGASIGISPIIAAQLFEARGLSNFAGLSSAPDALTDNGHDTSYGAGLKLGVQVPFAETWSFGASYQTKIWMSEFDDYAGLFAEGGDFDIPSTATIGVAGKATDALTIAFDVQWIGYGDIASISNPVLPNFFSSQLGLDDGGGFGWENMTVYKLGFAYDTSDSSTWRFGVSTTEQPVGSDDVLFNIVAPGVVENHYTVGYTAKTASGNGWSLSAMYAPSVSVSGPNPMDPAQNIEMSMDQFELEFSYSF